MVDIRNASPSGNPMKECRNSTFRAKAPWNHTLLGPPMIRTHDLSFTSRFETKVGNISFFILKLVLFLRYHNFLSFPSKGGQKTVYQSIKIMGITHANAPYTKSKFYHFLRIQKVLILFKTNIRTSKENETSLAGRDKL